MILPLRVGLKTFSIFVSEYRFSYLSYVEWKSHQRHRVIFASAEDDERRGLSPFMLGFTHSRNEVCAVALLAVARAATHTPGAAALAPASRQGVSSAQSRCERDRERGKHKNAASV